MLCYVMHESIITRFGVNNYVGNLTLYSKYRSDLIYVGGLGACVNSNINVCDFLSVLLFFSFLQHACRLPRLTDFTINIPKRVFSRKEVPFGALMIQSNV